MTDYVPECGYVCAYPLRPVTPGRSTSSKVQSCGAHHIYVHVFDARSQAAVWLACCTLGCSCWLFVRAVAS